MSNMKHQMYVNGFDKAEIVGTLMFKCRVSTVERDRQLGTFEDDVHTWLFDHLGDVRIETIRRDVVRHGDEFELVVKLKVTP